MKNFVNILIIACVVFMLMGCIFATGLNSSHESKDFFKDIKSQFHLKSNSNSSFSPYFYIPESDSNVPVMDNGTHFNNDDVDIILFIPPLPKV